MAQGLRNAAKIARGLLDLFHYSDEPREVIDPTLQLTNKNIKGAERDLSYGTRLTPFREEPEFIYKPYPEQSYWGSSNYNPERGLGEFVHTTRQPEEGFYDVSEDLEKLYLLAREEVMDLASKYDKQLDPQEVHRLAQGRAMSMAKDMGYLGLSNRKYRPEVYTQFNPVVPEQVGPSRDQLMNLMDYLRRVGNE